MAAPITSHPAPISYRWIVLAVGVFSQFTVSVWIVGLISIGPAIQHHYGLTLLETGVILNATVAGMVPTMLLWGVVADYFGDRPALALGMGAAATMMALAAEARSFAELTAVLVLTGLLCAGSTTATSPAIRAWFSVRERGTAMAVRQTSYTLGGAVGAIVFPATLLHFGFASSLLLASGLTGLSALVAAIGLRGPRPPKSAHSHGSARSLGRDRRIWRLVAATALALAGQQSVLTYLAVFLTERRGFGLADAAVVVVVVQLTGTAGRVVIGRVSDRLGRRMSPLRSMMLAGGLGLVSMGALVSAPLVIIVPLVVAAAGVAMLTLSLVNVAALELTDTERGGAAVGIIGTTASIAGVVGPLVFATIVSAGSWNWGFATIGLFSLGGAWLVHPLVALERRGWRLAATDAEALV